MRTGAKLWEFQTVPRAGEPFNETWGNGWENRGGTNMWGVRRARRCRARHRYLPIAGPAANYYGGDRPGNNAFANSIVAVDARTGKYLWHFQTVHHDIWDIDMPSAGALFDFVRNGTRVPAIAHVGKSSYFYVLDRATGKPLHRSRGDAGARRATCRPSGTRRRSRFRCARRRSPRELQRGGSRAARRHDARARRGVPRFMERSGGFYNAGPFTPFMYKAPDAPPKSTIQFPGGTGGVNWGGVAVDPTSGFVFANVARRRARRLGAGQGPERHLQLRGRGLEATVRSREHQRRRTVLHVQRAARRRVQRRTASAVGPSAPCQRPPWGKLVAVNANTGEIVWESVLGLNEALPEGKQLVGNGGSAGPDA